MRAERPSRTAIIVAKSLALTGMSPETRGLVNPDSLKFFQLALQGSGQRRFVEGLERRWFRKMTRAYETLMIPGLALHHALRKRGLEEVTRRKLQSGIQQVVQVGAGFDPMTFRLHREFPQARFVEFDHPATQKAKRKVMAALGGANKNLELCPIDLETSDPSAWMRMWDTECPAVVIIEGVLMYLDPRSVSQLFRWVSRGLTPDSRLLFTFMRTPRFRRQSPVVRWWLRFAKEPFRWSMPTGQIDRFLWEMKLTRCRIRSTRQVAGDLFRDDRPGRRREIADGEMLCEARLQVPSSRSFINQGIS